MTAADERALVVLSGASQWLKVRAKSGQKFYGIKAQSEPGRYYLTNRFTCDCPAGQRRPSVPCKHVAAVRMFCEMVVEVAR